MALYVPARPCPRRDPGLPAVESDDRHGDPDRAGAVLVACPSLDLSLAPGQGVASANFETLSKVGG